MYRVSERTEYLQVFMLQRPNKNCYVNEHILIPLNTVGKCACNPYVCRNLIFPLHAPHEIQLGSLSILNVLEMNMQT